MSETTPSHTAEAPAFTAASLAKLRSLAQPGFEPRTFVKSVTPFEIAALVLLVLLLIAVFVVYSYFILPDQVSYVQMSNQVAANRAKIEELQQQVVDPSLVTARFQEVRSSLEEFRGQVLRPREVGQREIQSAIGRALGETGVRLASAIQFRTKDPIAEAAKGEKKRTRKGRNENGAREIRSYPSMRMEFSISGNYGQLRSFISRFEGSGQFVVIDEITLNVEDDKARGPVGRASVGQPSQSGTITLDIAMTAYFQPYGPPSAAGVQ